MSLFAAQQRYRLFSPTGYNIPKPRFLFCVRFVSRFIDPVFLDMTSFYVTKMDRPQINYSIVELNQYNKKRLAQTKLTYGSLKFTMWDVADENALKLIEAYNRFYYGDFQQKDNQSWNYDITTNNFEYTPSWGLAANTTPNDGYFFDRIEVYEFYDQTYTQTNFINPKFENFTFQSLDMEDSTRGLEVDVSCKYEGIVYEAIAQPVTPALADAWGIEFRNDYGLPPGALRIPGVQNLINYGTNTLTNIFTSLGLGDFAAQNLSNAIAQQGLAKLGPKLNTGFGKILFGGIDSTAQKINNVQNRINTGQIVNDVATGNLSSVFRSLGF